MITRRSLNYYYHCYNRKVQCSKSIASRIKQQQQQGQQRTFGVVIHGSNNNNINSRNGGSMGAIQDPHTHTTSNADASSNNVDTAAAAAAASNPASSLHFASTDYMTSFLSNKNHLHHLSTSTKDSSTVLLRQQTLHYLNHVHDPKLWFEDPIVSLVNGEKVIADGDNNMNGSMIVDTYDAFGMVNGKQILANPQQVAYIQSHIQSLSTTTMMTTTSNLMSSHDLRKPIRYVEDKIFHKHVGYIVANQALDFCKQDGITEVEEAIQVYPIERSLNDLLFQQEQQGIVQINRQPIYISTVSNFTNFLDLCRKALRSLELGIPIIVLCRTDQRVSQHSYRWTQLLIDLCCDVDIDPKMITYISASLQDIQSILQVCEHTTGNLYATCSRHVASNIMNIYPKTIASTGGPNTMICTQWDETSSSTISKMAQAIADSATIESAGQCTALRHCIVPTAVTDQDCTKMLLDNITVTDSIVTAISENQYANIIKRPNAAPSIVSVQQPEQELISSSSSSSAASASASLLPTNDYQRLDTKLNQKDVDIYIKINTSFDELPKKSNQMPEYWRNVVVDFTKMDLVHDKYITQGKIRIRPVNESSLNQLAQWINTNQPISLAINGPRHEAINVGIALWERTSLVVNTIGSTDHNDTMPPAMTCQARPQDGECFGEFPPRNEMNQYTLFPVIIPSSNPSYDSCYKEDYLQKRGQQLSDYIVKSTKSILLAITDDAVRGYCVLLVEYLQNACRKNPKKGFGRTRSIMFGIQRPPLGLKTILRCTEQTTFDELAKIYILFQVTNARDQATISISPTNDDLIKICQQLKLPIVVESDTEFASVISNRNDLYHCVTVTGLQTQSPFPMVGNFVSLYLPFGHIKSTMANDDEFELKARISEKWLSTLF